MSVHQIDRSTFLVEYPGLRDRAQDASRLVGRQGVPDHAFGAELRRLLYESMESTPAARWVRERGHGVKIAPTEPHRGKFVFRMTFEDDDQAMMFAMAWAADGSVDQRPSVSHARAA